MAVARLSVTSAARSPPRRANLSDEVELYQRTYSTLLRSSGETRLRVLESSHRAMGSSLHPLAGSPSSTSARSSMRSSACPTAIVRARDDRHGPGRGRLRARRASAAGGLGVRRGARAAAALVRRRRRDARRAARLASPTWTICVPTLVAFQIEWNKMHERQRRGRLAAADRAAPEECSERAGRLAATTGRACATAGATRSTSGSARSRSAARTCACGCSAARRSAMRA